MPSFLIIPFALKDTLMFQLKVDLAVSCGLFFGSFNLGPVVQSVVSLTSSLRVISLTILADSIYNILICFAEKM